MTKAKPRRLTCEYGPCSGPMPTTGRHRRFCSKPCTDAAWKAAHPERARKLTRDWVAANPERRRAIRKKSADKHRTAQNARNRATGQAGGYAHQYARTVFIHGREVLASELRARVLWLRYRMTPERWDEMLIAQNGRCAICAAPEPPDRRLAVDHDHACCPHPKRSCGKCIRGLLCTSCNNRLGIVEDEPWMAAAQAYRARYTLAA